MSSSDPSPAAPMTLADLGTVCLRHRWWVAGVAVLVGAAVLIGAMTRTPLYEATASLVVDRGRKAVDFQGDPETGRIEFSLLNTYRDQLLARPVLAQTLRVGGLDVLPVYAGASDPTEVLRNRVMVTTSRDSWVVNVALRDEDPGRAQRALQTLIDGFMEEQGRQQSERSSGALAFLSRQVNDARVRLEESRQREQAFRSEHGILSVDPEKNHLAQTLENLTRMRSELDRQLASDQALEDEAHRAESGAVEDAQRVDRLLRVEKINQHPVVVKQQQALFELLPQQAVLEQKYKPQHPRMIEFTERLTTERRQLTEAVTIARASISTQLDQTRASVAAIDARVAAQQKELALYRDDLIRLTGLGEETASREKLYQQLLTRLNEEEVSSRLNARQLTVIDQPQSKPQPVNIRPVLAAAAALVAALVAGIGAALGREALDRRVRGAEMVKTLTGLPLVGALPAVPVASVKLDAGEDPNAYRLAEAIRSLRATLLLTTLGGATGRVLAVTSSAPREGKSSVSAHLAISLARTGKRVLLIDADMHRPTLHLVLGETVERGLSHRLMGEAGVQPVPSRHGLDFLGVGTLPPRPGELLHTPYLADLLADARARYDFTIIDTPPLGAVSDALVLAGAIDGLLVVVRDGVTNKGLLKEALARLAPCAAKVMGVVLNAELYRRPGYDAYGYSGAGNRAAAS